MARPREFKLDDALDAALSLFWEKGFEGTSYTDLVAATKVARPGLYLAFGDKTQLFLQVLQRYESKHLGFVSEALESPTAREVFKKMLHGSIKLATREDAPKGCLAINGAIAGTDESQGIRLELNRRWDLQETCLRKRFKRAKKENDLTGALSPSDLARYACVLIQGLAVQAKAGVDRRELLRVANLAISTCFAK